MSPRLTGRSPEPVPASGCSGRRSLSSRQAAASPFTATLRLCSDAAVALRSGSAKLATSADRCGGAGVPVASSGWQNAATSVAQRRLALRLPELIPGVVDRPENFLLQASHPFPRVPRVPAGSVGQGLKLASARFMVQSNDICSLFCGGTGAQFSRAPCGRYDGQG